MHKNHNVDLETPSGSSSQRSPLDELLSRLDDRLVEPEAVSYSVTWTAPLMLEVYDAHRVLLDPTGFFAAEMKRFGDVVRERGIYKVSPGVWRVPTVAR